MARRTREQTNINPEWDRDELEDYTRQLEMFVRDISTNGLRHDMNPTMMGDSLTEPAQMYSFLTNYFKRAETDLRHRAEDALTAKK